MGSRVVLGQQKTEPMNLKTDQYKASTLKNRGGIKKGLKRNDQNCVTIQSVTNIHVMRVPEKEKKERKAEKSLKK